jgi:hypothetical protein
VLVRVGVRVRVGVAVGLGVAATPAETIRLEDAARSPEFVPVKLTLLPQAFRVTVLKAAGAVHRKLKVAVPDTAALGLVWVISLRWPVPERTLVLVALVPPVVSVPLAAETFRPPWFCVPALTIWSVYSFVELGDTVVGPERVTVGVVPPAWH